MRKGYRRGAMSPKLLVALLVALMGVLLALKMVTDKKAANMGLEQPVPPPSPSEAQQEVGQALPPDAAALSSPVSTETRSNIPQGGQYEGSYGGYYSQPEDVPVNAADADCVKAFSDNPDAIIRHFDKNFKFFFNTNSNMPEDDTILNLFLDYGVCRLISGGQLDCVQDNLNRVCYAADYYEFLYSAMRKTINDGKCEKFINNAFRDGRPSPDFCRVISDSIARKRTPECRSLGLPPGCESNFLFIRGRAACSRLSGPRKKECQLSAALVIGDAIPDDKWLPRVLESRDPSVCAPLAKKLATGYCTSSFRHKIMADMVKQKAEDDKRMGVQQQSKQPKGKQAEKGQ
ncbi:MAG: hypothetical protein M0025_02115 [Elusimicrobia bacterium]|nr:hypothetical protein [Elusimicrobiota bacterium]